MVRIKAQRGTDEANFAESRFPVPADGIIDVSPEAAAPLLNEGGFISLEPAPALPDGLVQVRGAPGSGCTVGGVSYNAGDDGLVSVPAYAVADLAAHGFKPVGE